MIGEMHEHEKIINICEKCGGEMTAECTMIIKGKKICRHCIENAVFRTEGQKVSGTKNTVLCFFLSLIPGVGHVYLGFKNKGLAFMLAFFGSWIMVDFFRTAGPIIGLIWVYAFIDSVTSCTSLNKGEVLQDISLPALEDISKKVFSNQKMVGFGLIVLGALGFLRTFVYNINRILREYFRNWSYISFENLALSVIFLGLGIYLVKKAKKQEGKEI